MRFTIVTPTLNAGSGLESTLFSVLAQKDPNLEYWVIDGGSTDETTDLLRRYDSVVRWISEPDHGQGDAVNKGFHRATGDVFGWINASDTYSSATFETVRRAFESHPDVDFVYGDCNIVDPTDRVLRTHHVGPLANRQLIRRGFGGFHPPTVFFRRRLLQRVGGCDITLRHGVGYDLWCRMIQVAEPLYVTEVLANYRALPRRWGKTRRELALSECREIRKRYLKGALDRSWCWYYDLWVKLFFLSEPILIRRYPEKFKSAFF